MVGVQFEGVGEGEGEISINKFISGDFDATDWDENDEFLDTATEIQVWDGGTYTFYFYLNEHEIDDVKHPKGWCDDWGEYTEDALSAGTCVWFHNRGSAACTITTPGQIITDDTAEIQCPANRFMMVANFMPVELDLNDAEHVTWDGIVGTDWDENDEFLDTATEIQVWDGGTYVFYFYLNAHTIDDVDFAKGWCDDWGETMSDTIPVGRGFWVHARTGAFTIKFNK